MKSEADSEGNEIFRPTLWKRFVMTATFLFMAYILFRLVTHEAPAVLKHDTSSTHMTVTGLLFMLALSAITVAYLSVRLGKSEVSFAADGFTYRNLAREICIRYSDIEDVRVLDVYVRVRIAHLFVRHRGGRLLLTNLEYSAHQFHEMSAAIRRHRQQMRGGSPKYSASHQELASEAPSLP
ncbi:MAG: hypothetical protein KGN33_03885 [Paracoccaceae bacterium]|nr:hypothetical protein [Paracoccaceae bacterium]